MADSPIIAVTPSASAPASTPSNAPARLTAGAATPTPAGAQSQEAGDDGFGPAVVVGSGAPPSVFSVYTAKGEEAAHQPTLRVSAPKVSLGSSQVPASTLYERLGQVIYQIQLAFQGGGLGSSYTLGYRLLV